MKNAETILNDTARFVSGRTGRRSSMYVCMYVYVFHKTIQIHELGYYGVPLSASAVAVYGCGGGRVRITGTCKFLSSYYKSITIEITPSSPVPC